jgi:hypothetical protein
LRHVHALPSKHRLVTDSFDQLIKMLSSPFHPTQVFESELASLRSGLKYRLAEGAGEWILKRIVKRYRDPGFSQETDVQI